MALVLGVAAAGQALSFAPDISQARTATVDVTRLLEHTPEIDAWSNQGQRIKSLQNGDIDIKNVYFRYPSRFHRHLYSLILSRPEELILRNMSLDVRAGQYVALVGRSGCGKSTVAALIERFYDPSAGQILVDNVRVSDYNLSHYRRNLAIVSQEPT